MVYCGKLSKGCERCRQRKIKCDERKPGCVNCHRSQMQCPGYRDLTKVAFRNQTAQVIKRLQDPLATNKQNAPPTSKSTSSERTMSYSLSYPSQSICQLGASFFFAKHIFEKGTFFNGYRSWLTELYFVDSTTGLLRAVIDAVGLLALANTSYTPALGNIAQERYSLALMTLKDSLNDPAQVKSDTTLLAITLLIQFEVLNFRSWERYRHWSAHVNAALALLELRGKDQLTRERGAQLYVQVRSEILLACIQQQVEVPKALVQITYDFQTSAIREQWRDNNIASPASITEICFRIINLRAALRKGELRDLREARTRVVDIYDDLEAWRAVLAASWNYTVEVAEVDDGSCYNRMRHTYPNLWIAEGWNTWRILRFLVIQMIMEIGIDVNDPASLQDSIRQMSTDICVSVSNFMESPRIISLIQPLYVISLETINPHSLRSFAVHQLRYINASTGVRQAGLLAETATKTFSTDLENALDP